MIEPRPPYARLPTLCTTTLAPERSLLQGLPHRQGQGISDFFFMPVCPPHPVFGPASLQSSRLLGELSPVTCWAPPNLAPSLLLSQESPRPCPLYIAPHPDSISFLHNLGLHLPASPTSFQNHRFAHTTYSAGTASPSPVPEFITVWGNKLSRAHHNLSGCSNPQLPCPAVSDTPCLHLHAFAQSSPPSGLPSPAFLYLPLASSVLILVPEDEDKATLHFSPPLHSSSESQLFVCIFSLSPHGA